MSEPVVNVVLIEDDKEIRRFVHSALGASGFQVWPAETAERGLIEAATRQPELIILDLGLPDRDGLDVIRDLRAWTAMPILILSARGEETQKVAALDAGADDYLTKPFGVPELLARMRALLRRTLQKEDGGKALVEFGDLRIDLAHRTVTRAGEAVHLTPIEYRMLTRAAHPRRPRADPPATAEGSLGAVARGSHPLPARVHGRPAPQTGSRTGAAATPAHGVGRGVSAGNLSCC